MVQNWSLPGKPDLAQPCFNNVNIFKSGIFSVLNRALEKIFGNIFFLNNVLRIIAREKGSLVNG